jgi:ATP-dependent Lhr-like helicase
VPANRFEVLECRAALDAGGGNEQDADPLAPAHLDVLAQHVLGWPAAARSSDALYARCDGRTPYAELSRNRLRSRRRFRRHRRLCAEGLRALRAPRPTRMASGASRIPRAQQYRMNVGTIVEEPMLKVRLVRRAVAAASGATTHRCPRRADAGARSRNFHRARCPGDTFVFGGEVLRYEG